MSDSSSPEPAWAAFVALDWGDRKHCWKLCPAGDEKHCECGELLHTPPAVNDWVSSLGSSGSAAGRLPFVWSSRAVH